MYEKNGAEYLAGMWRDNTLEDQLCWRVTDPRLRPRDWRAPSLSWASIDGKVMYSIRTDSTFKDIYARVLDTKMTSTTEDPFGEVCSGSLRIGCSGLLAGTIRDCKTVKISLDESEVTLNEEWPILRDYVADYTIDKEDDTVYLMPLQGGTTSARSKTNAEADLNDDQSWLDEMEVRGLVLRSTDRAVGEFHRIGAFRLSKDRLAWGSGGVDENRYDPFLRAFAQVGGVIANSKAAGVVENLEFPALRYIISVV